MMPLQLKIQIPPEWVIDVDCGDCRFIDARVSQRKCIVFGEGLHVEAAPTPQMWFVRRCAVCIAMAEDIVEETKDDGPLTDEDREAIERGLEDMDAGRTVPHSEVVREWGEMDAKEDAEVEELRILKTRIADAWQTSHLLGTALGDVVKMCQAHPLPAGQAIAHLEAALKVLVDLVSGSGEFRSVVPRSRKGKANE